MSVLTNHTNIIFHNETNYFLEIIFNGEQNSNLTIFNDTTNIITTGTSTVFDYLYSLVAGKNSKIVHVNIPLLNTAKLSVKCNAKLFFHVHPKIADAENVDHGSFELNTDFQNNDIEIKFTEKHGVGYDENGDVCINIMQPVYRDLVVKPCVYLAGKPLKLNYEDAFCKIKV